MNKTTCAKVWRFGLLLTFSSASTYGPSSTGAQALPEFVAQAEPYYVVGRYHCRDAQDSNKDRGSCDITTRSAASCQAAMGLHRSTVAQLGDPCKNCLGSLDNTKVWVGRLDFIQGGPCQGTR